MLSCVYRESNQLIVAALVPGHAYTTNPINHKVSRYFMAIFIAIVINIYSSLALRHFIQDAILCRRLSNSYGISNQNAARYAIKHCHYG